ncbi:MAG TPA: 30S ribosome-binding factor RbfA [Pantanalinema sp.]
MGNQRAERVSEVIKDVVADAIRRLKDSRITGMVSITDVEVSGDLRHAKIFVSIYGDEPTQALTMEGLSSAVGFIRSEVGKAVKLRVVPELHFKQDRSIEHGAHIHDLLARIKREGGEPEGHGE